MEAAPVIAAKPRWNLRKTLRVVLLVALALYLFSIGVLLLGSAVYKMSRQSDVAKMVRAKGDIETLRIALDSYKTLGGEYPSTAQGLKAVVERPTTDTLPRQWAQGMDSLPKDPWGNDYHYQSPGRHNPDSYDLYSAGPDGIVGTADDLGNWEEDLGK